MIKLFLNKFGPGLLDKWWSSLHHPSGFAIRYVFWTTALMVLVVGVMAVDVPWKEKTIPELYIGNEVEQYRLHQNSSDWYVAETKRQSLQKECDYFERRVDKLQLAVWQLMAIKGVPVVEVEKAKHELAGAKKKYAVADLALTGIELSLKKLVASR